MSTYLSFDFLFFLFLDVCLKRDISGSSVKFGYAVKRRHHDYEPFIIIAIPRVKVIVNLVVGVNVCVIIVKALIVRLLLSTLLSFASVIVIVNANVIVAIILFHIRPEYYHLVSFDFQTRRLYCHSVHTLMSFIVEYRRMKFISTSTSSVTLVWPFTVLSYVCNSF